MRWRKSSPVALIFTVLVVLFAASGQAAMAQQASTNVTASPAPSVASTSSTDSPDDRYRIGPGDVLDIRYLRSPELSREAVRVDNRGMIRMPMLDDDIQAACLTEGELAKKIATLYLKYKRNPRVDVFIKEYNSQPVAVIGAVNSPGRFQLQRPVRLLELLTFAGGPNERAGARIQIVRAPSSSLCETPAVNTSDEGAAQEEEDSLGRLVSYKLSDTLLGHEQSNPYMRPGDIINLPAAEDAFVVGNVLRPSAIPLKEPVTLSQAVAMVGGTLPDTKSDKIKIIRQVPGSMNKTEIIVNLKAINKRQAEDVALQPGDIVDVPTSGGKSLLRSLVGTIAPTISQTSIRVIR